MPALSTRGGMSARGFGLFGFKQSFLTGAFGLFTMGNNTIRNMQYAWAPEVTASGRNFTQTVQMSGAASNSTKGIFPLAIADGVHKATQKYTWANNTTTVGGVLTNGQAYGSATGNSQYGIFYAGVGSGSTPTTLTTIYEYANDGCSNGGALTFGSDYTNALGNSTFGIISRANSNASSAATMKYTYPNGSVAAGTSFPVSRTIGCRYFGGPTMGIWGRTTSVNLDVQKYVWASDTTAISTQSPAGSNNAQISQGTGNDVYAITPLTTSGVATQKFTWATETWGTGLNFLETTNFGGSANTGVAGVNA